MPGAAGFLENSNSIPGGRRFINVAAENAFAGGPVRALPPAPVPVTAGFPPVAQRVAPVGGLEESALRMAQVKLGMPPPMRSNLPVAAPDVPFNKVY
jgi:hypothetical protein